MSQNIRRTLVPCERLLAIPLIELSASMVAEWRLPGLPSGTLDVPECGLVLTGTADTERFDLGMVKTSNDYGRDVLLVRLTTGQYPATADIVLRTPAEPILLSGLVPCRLGTKLWFVSERYGRCVTVGEGGLAIRWHAPASAIEQADGCGRASDEIERFLKGGSF